MKRIALLARRAVNCEGVDRAEGEIFELDAPNAAAALIRARGGLAFAPNQPRYSSSMTPKRQYRRKKPITPEPVA